MLKRFLLYYHTIRYLKPIQILFQLYYKFLRLTNLYIQNKLKSIVPHQQKISLSGFIDKPISYDGDLTFDFLNIAHQFSENIRWNLSTYGKLWTYNLCYFDYLNQSNFDKKQGLALMSQFANDFAHVKDGLEPYPSSIRVINWVKFVLKNEINDVDIDKVIYTDVQNISRRLEYHLLGNHLIENGFAMLFGAVFFNDQELLDKSKSLLMVQLNEQILSDGGHFELSPMYHQIILDRLLDCINLLSKNDENFGGEFTSFLKSKSTEMLSWLESMTFKNGDIPHVNDSVSGIAPTTTQLLEYAKSLNLNAKDLKLSNSGYRKFDLNKYEVLVDVGNIGPDYIPGHAHSDTLNFVLNYKGKPVIVDTGTSTYEKTEQRTMDRSTQAHNTVVVNDRDQSEVWGGFRVAKRAKTTLLSDSSNSISATHDGYRSIGITHQRDFELLDKGIIIKDKINKDAHAVAYFHFAPGITVMIKDDRAIISGLGELVFKKFKSINLSKYLHAEGFNQTAEALVILVEFDRLLETEIYFI